MSAPLSAAVTASAAARLADLGGYLRCEVCSERRGLGDIGAKLAHGWPRCHEQTMRWWTARQVEAGEDQPGPTP